MSTTEGEIKKEKGTSNTTGVDVEQPQSISDLLKDQREAAKRQMTDAIKMQKYHALSDVFGALGKMGGAMAGGAIGGNMLDSAPNVGEYKESRGYLDAFENAKKANERLRNLDDTEFQLKYKEREKADERAYKEGQIKDQRAYEAQVTEATRKYEAEKDKLNKEWQMKFAEYQSQLAEARAANNLVKEAEIKEKMAKAARAHDIALQKLKNQGDLDLKKLGLQTSQWQASEYNTEALGFNDNSAIEIPKKYYDSLVRTILASGQADKNTVDKFIYENPAYVRDFLGRFGGSTGSAPATPVTQQTGYSAQSAGRTAPATPVATFDPNMDYYSWKANQTRNGWTTGSDIEDINEFLSEFE